MIEKTIEISGQPVAFKASAAIPRLYRAKFHRDIFKDFAKLEKSSKKKTKSKETDKTEPASQTFDFEPEDLEIFENLAYVMAYHADKSIPTDINDWLDRFDVFSIYQILPQLLELWGLNLSTVVEAKKKLDKLTAR